MTNLKPYALGSIVPALARSGRGTHSVDPIGEINKAEPPARIGSVSVVPTGLVLFGVSYPTACAVGCILTPLPRLVHFQPLAHCTFQTP